MSTQRRAFSERFGIPRPRPLALTVALLAATAVGLGAPVRIEGGWTHDVLASDGHGPLYGTTAGGTLIQRAPLVPDQRRPGVDRCDARRALGHVRPARVTGYGLHYGQTPDGALSTATRTT